MELKKSLNVRFQQFGLHRWPNPTVDRVKFLDNLHSHVFNFRVKIGVSHNEREVEFFDAKQTFLEFLSREYPKADNLNMCLNFDSDSCETIAEKIIKQFKGIYNIEEVEVQEDNQDSALVCVV